MSESKVKAAPLPQEVTRAAPLPLQEVAGDLAGEPDGADGGGVVVGSGADLLAVPVAQEQAQESEQQKKDSN